MKKSLWEKGYFFQFNPQTISDNKSTEYEVRPYAGLPYNDYNWSNGGERIISFQLFLDDTPQSHIATFRPDVLADQIDGTSTNKNAFQWTSSGAYSRTRAHERGVLDNEPVQTTGYACVRTGSDILGRCFEKRSCKLHIVRFGPYAHKGNGGCGNRSV